MKLRARLLALFVTAALGAATPPGVHAAPNHSKLVYPGADGKLVYAPYTPQGDTLLDFSHCGFRGGEQTLPVAVEKIRLTPAPAGDDTARIQAALDALAQLPLGPDGLRGAVVLAKGTYRVEGTLKLTASGLVLRGEGQGEAGTVLLATGTAQRTLIEIRGASAPKTNPARATPITDNYVPVGARSFNIANPAHFRVGDTVFVTRRGNAEWISFLGMDRIGQRSDGGTVTQWQPFNLNFDRIITAIDGHRITVDAPIACAIETRWGGGEVVPYRDPARIEMCGVENLRGISAYDPKVTADYRKQFRYASDEAHAFYLVSFEHAKNSWARDLTAVHFYHGVSTILGGAKWITVRDSTSLAPVSVITGGRRYPFNINGQLSLVLRCNSEHARHAYVLGSRVPGPNAFVFGTSVKEYGNSEPHHRWSVGGLYDNIASDIAFQDRYTMGSGHGWAGANYVAWNTRGKLVCQQPPGAQNFALGHVGEKDPGAFKRPSGYWESHGKPLEPVSLYVQQLIDRVGQATAARTLDRNERVAVGR